MVNSKHVSALLESQRVQIKELQETLQIQEKTLHAYEEQHRILKAILQTMVDENNIMREQLGLETEVHDDLLGF